MLPRRFIYLHRRYWAERCPRGFKQDVQQRRGLANSISSYLIKPVQRITKYQLLLKVRHTPPAQTQGGRRPGGGAGRARGSCAPSSPVPLQELLSCCEEGKGEIKDGLDVMLSVPKRANDAMHLAMMEGERPLRSFSSVLHTAVHHDPSHLLTFCAFNLIKYQIGHVYIPDVKRNIYILMSPHATLEGESFLVCF